MNVYTEDGIIEFSGTPNQCKKHNKEKYPKLPDGKTKVDCYYCGYEGDIDTYAQAGGIFYENTKRLHITGDCCKCGKNLINFHVTRD